MARAARSDPLVERVDQLADVYGEVLLGLYDELTDQRERTEAVAARADGVLGEARRLMEDLGSAATQARAIEQEAARIAPVVQPAPAPAGPAVVAPDPQAEARTREALARLGVLESMAATLEQSVRERTDDAVARCEELTRGLDTQLRAHVQESVGLVRAEVQQTVIDLRQHVRELLDAVTRETHEATRRAALAPEGGGAAVAAAPPVDTAALADEVRRHASAAIAEEVRQQATTTVADQVGRAAATITEQVRAQAMAGVAEQVRAQTEATVAEQVRAQTEATVAEQVRAQTQATVAEQVRAHAAGAVAEQVRQQAAGAVAEQVRTQAEAAVTEQVRQQAAGVVAEQVRQQAAGAVAEQVRTQAAAAIAIEMREQSGVILEDLRRQAAAFATSPAAGTLAGQPPVGTEQMWAALREEIERRTSNFSAAEERAAELANRLTTMITEGRSSLREAQNDRDAAAFALRESRAELEAAKRALDVSDLSFTLDRLRRAELLLYGTAAMAVLAIGLWLWTLLS